MVSSDKLNEQSFVSTREAAELLGVSVRTVQLWVESGVLHAWKTAGGHRRIARASVETVLAEQQAVIETVSGLKLLKIVLIDDNPAELKLYKLKLESLNLPLELTLAADGYDGLIAVGRADADIVIASLDIAGIDTIAMLRAIGKAAPSAQLIALTNRPRFDRPWRDRLPRDVALLSAIDDLESIGPMLKRKKASSR